MWNVTEGYRTAIAAKSVQYKWYGTITFSNGTSVTFNHENVDQNKSKITRQCVKGENLEIGGCFASELVLGLRDSSDWKISDKSYNYYDATVVLKFQVYNKTAQDWEPEVLCGTFVINKAVRTYHTVMLTAYDAINKLNDKLSVTYTGDFEPYDAISAICTSAGITLGMSRAQVEAYPNGNISTLKMGKYKTGTTYKKILSDICGILGTNAVCDRYGRLILMNYGTTSVKTIGASNRYSSSYIDYTGYYNLLYYACKNGTVEVYYMERPTPVNPNSNDDPVWPPRVRSLAMSYSKNTLLDDMTQSARESILDHVLSAIIMTTYSPCDIRMPADPALDLGDLVTITGGELEHDVDVLCTKMEMPLYGQMKIVSEAGNYELEITEYPTIDKQKEQEQTQDVSTNITNIDNSVTNIDNRVTNIGNDVGDLSNDVSNLTTEVSSLAGKTAVNYIFPYQIISGGVSDGSNAYALRFKFKCDRDGDTVAFYAMFSFTVSTTGGSGTYGDCNLTVQYLLDDAVTSSAIHTYGDGSAILTLNGCIANPTAGEHLFDVKFALSGGSIS